jgi:hypothetical protein
MLNPYQFELNYNYSYVRTWSEGPVFTIYNTGIVKIEGEVHVLGAIYEYYAKVTLGRT